MPSLPLRSEVPRAVRKRQPLVWRLILAATTVGVIALGLGCGSRREGAPGAGATSPGLNPGRSTGAGGGGAERHGRLVILGFDGVDPRWLERWAAEGKLPNINSLRERPGGRHYGALRSTNPPQSPVAWTTFATGTLPGEHGIFDFIGRKLQPEGPLPVLPMQGTSTFEPQPAGPPVARNLRTGEPFWKTLADDGVRVVAINVPYSFPPDPMAAGRMLSGLGVPDLRETNSTFTFAASDLDVPERAVGGGVLLRMSVTEGVGRFELSGPSVPGAPSGTRMKLPVEVRSDGGALRVRIDGAETRVPVRESSPFLEVKFRHEGTEVWGLLQVIAVRAEPSMQVFVSPISFHPARPYAPFAFPSAFAQALVEDVHGFYKTVGWDHDTSALNEEVIDEDLWLAEMDRHEKQRAQMLLSRVRADDWDLLIWVSTSTDRVAHMFYRLIDPDHPRFDAALAARHGDAIEREYRRMDETIGRTLEALRPSDTLIVVSDHGFHNYRRGLHVNQWLRQNGFLSLKNDRVVGRDFLMDVDWSQTQAYALGTGQIYINLRGREREGIVNPTDAADVARRIREGLLGLRDSERGGAQVVREVYLGAEVYRGGRSADAPDLQIAFAENYRTSWETILGGAPLGLFADNPKKWSGDHAASDVRETPGILLTNRPFRAAEPGIVDIAPTALRHFGRTPPGRYQGTSIFEAPGVPDAR
jgi:predicted AlkP superfamily phosphohydrolase/phosphomutase